MSILPFWFPAGPVKLDEESDQELKKRIEARIHETYKRAVADGLVVATKQAPPNCHLCGREAEKGRRFDREEKDRWFCGRCGTWCTDPNHC